VHDMSGNAELSRSVERLRLKVEWMFAGYAASRGESAWIEHRLLVEAIADGNTELAAKVSREHVAKSRLAYLSLLDGPYDRRERGEAARELVVIAPSP
jgi:DNA-binding GntR family transcriptional regulator